MKFLYLFFIFNDAYLPDLELAAQIAGLDDRHVLPLDVDDKAEAGDEAPRKLSMYPSLFHVDVLNHLSPDPLQIMQLRHPAFTER